LEGASPSLEFEKSIDDKAAGISRFKIKSRTMPEAFPIWSQKASSYAIGSLYATNGPSKYSRWFRVTMFSEQGKAAFTFGWDLDALLVALQAKEWCLTQEQNRPRTRSPKTSAVPGRFKRPMATTTPFIRIDES